MGPAATILLLWLAFAVSHMVLSSVRLRPRLIALVGDQAFQGIYSLIALGIFVPICIVYFGNKHAGPLLWSIPLTTTLYWVIQLGMGVAFILLFAGLVSPSPTLMSAGATGAEAYQPKGVHFITRHAVFMGLAIFGILHLIPNGYASDVAFFGGFPVFVVVGSMHQDRRRLETDGERYRPFYEATPLIPFTGRSTLRGLRELSWLAVGLGIVATLIVRQFHGAWFGG